MGQKTPDRDAIPLCCGCHLLDPTSYHEIENETVWEKIHAIQIVEIRQSLIARFNSEQGANPCIEES